MPLSSLMRKKYAMKKKNSHKEKMKNRYYDIFGDIQATPDNLPFESHSHYEFLSLWGKIKYYFGILWLKLTGYYDDGNEVKNYYSRNCKFKQNDPRRTIK